VAGGDAVPTQDKDCNRSVNQTEDFELYSPSRFGNLNRPMTCVPAADGKSPIGLLSAITYPDGHVVRFRSPDE